MTEDRGGFTIQRTQVSDLSGWLKDFVWMSRELDTVITRQAVMANPYQPAGKGSETPLVFDETASDAALDLRGTLVVWAKAVWAAGGPPVPAGMRAVDAAMWLRHNITRLASIDDAAQAYKEIGDVHARIMGILDRPDDKPIIGDPVAARDTLLGKAEIAKCAIELGDEYRGLTADRVRSLARNNRVTVALEVDGECLYRLGDVMDAHTAVKQRKGTAA